MVFRDRFSWIPASGRLLLGLCFEAGRSRFFSEFQPWIPGDGASLCLFFPEDALPAGRFYFCFEGGWHKGKRTEEHILVKNTIFCPQSTEGGPPGA